MPRRGPKADQTADEQRPHPHRIKPPRSQTAADLSRQRAREPKAPPRPPASPRRARRGAHRPSRAARRLLDRGPSTFGATVAVTTAAPPSVAATPAQESHEARRRVGPLGACRGSPRRFSRFLALIHPGHIAHSRTLPRACSQCWHPVVRRSECAGSRSPSSQERPEQTVEADLGVAGWGVGPVRRELVQILACCARGTDLGDGHRMMRGRSAPAAVRSLGPASPTSGPGSRGDEIPDGLAIERGAIWVMRRPGRPRGVRGGSA